MEFVTEHKGIPCFIPLRIYEEILGYIEQEKKIFTKR